MNDPQVFQKLIPDKFLMSFWEQNIQSDGRNFSQHREVIIRRIKDSQVIINHDGNVLQSSFKLVKAESKISYTNLLQNNLLQAILEKIEIDFEEQNNSQFVAMENLKESFVQKFDKFSRVLPKDKVLKIEINLIFDNNNILLALLYSILVQLYQFLNSANELEQQNMYLPLLIKGFSQKEDSAKIWFIDPNQNELQHQKYFPEFLIVLLIDNKNEQSIAYSAGNGITQNDYKNVQKVLSEIQLDRKIPNLYNFVISKENNVAKIIQIIRQIQLLL